MTNPMLRFKRADGTEFPDWVKQTVGDVLAIKHGRDYKGLASGDIPVLGTGGQIATVGEALCDWPCVLIGRKGTINKPQFMDRPFWSVDTLFYSQPKHGHDPKFQYYLFETIDWLKYNEASGVPSLSASTIEKIAIQVPCPEEQRKVEEFLSTLDAKISFTKRKLQELDKLKKGLMRKIFRQEVRFKAKDGGPFAKWQVLTVGDVAETCGGGTPSTTEEAYWGGDIQWLTPTEIDSKYVHESLRTITQEGLDNSSAKILPKGALILTTRATLGACCINDSDRKICTNQGFQSLLCNDKILSEYMYYVVTSEQFQKDLQKNASGSTFLEISPKNLKKISVPVPCLAEQKRIAEFLSSLDEKIVFERKRLSVLKRQKQAFMQQMFV